MRHIRRLEDAHLDRQSIVTIGAFDGVHRGHRHLVAQLVESARNCNCVPVVLTFFPHPDEVIAGRTGRFYLTSPDEKAELLGEIGVELVVTHPFDEGVRHMRAADFVGGLTRYLNMRELWVGRDFALGYGREGDVGFLRDCGAAMGFKVRVVDLMMAENGEIVSSERIRRALRAGDVELAARYLGRPYRVQGVVVKGDGRGRTLGFPTANIETWELRLIPATGVYACNVWLDGRRYPAVTNIGVRPTFDGGGEPALEAHLLDFDGDLYGRELAVDFIARLRDERRFGGPDELIAQINADITYARRVLAGALG